MKTLRYINLGEVEPNLISAIWEFSRVCSAGTEPIFFSFIPKKSMILLVNLFPKELYLKVEELPQNIETVRLYVPENPAGTLLFDAKSALMFCLHIPIIDIEKVKLGARLATMDAHIKVLAKYGITVSQKNNDLFFEKEGKIKKFSGFVQWDFGDWRSSGNIMTFDFNGELAKRVYKFDTEKFKKKGDIKDITDIVGGLHEKNSSVGFEIAPEIAQELANNLGLEMKVDTLTKEEMDTLQTLSDKLNNSNWKLNAKHPEIKTE